MKYLALHFCLQKLYGSAYVHGMVMVFPEDGGICFCSLCTIIMDTWWGLAITLGNFEKALRRDVKIEIKFL